MTATAIDFATTRFTEQAQKPVVYLRSAWDDAWVEYENLHCVSLRMGVGAQIDQAQFEFHYGNIHRDGAASPQIEPRVSILRKFVKIEVANPNSTPAADLDGFIWYGIIVNEIVNEFGGTIEEALQDEAGNDIQDEAADPIDVDGLNSGLQEFTAFGMEWMLTRVFLNKSVYEDTSGNDVEVGRVIPFNAGTKKKLESSDVQVLGNKAPGQNRFIRPDLVSAAVPWTAFDILSYLLDVFQPTEAPVFEMHSTAADFCDWLILNNVTVGPTLFDALNQLISPHRGITWSVFVDDVEAVPKMYIRIYSFAASDIALDGGATLKANDTQITLNDSQMRAVESLRHVDTSRVFEQVKVYGARRGACFTLGYQDDTLAQGWSTFQLDAYANAASGVTPLGEKKKQADAFRSTDTMANVLTRFIIPHYWDGLVGMRQPPYTFFPACPALDFAGNIIQDESVSFWHPGMRIENWIPMRENVDYQYDATAPDDYNEDFLLPPYRKPFVLYMMADGNYISAERSGILSYGESATGKKAGIHFSATVQPTSDQFGLYITPSSLAHAHSSGTELTASNASFDDTTDIDREVDWKHAVATVFAEFDELVCQVYPSTPQAGTNGQQSVLEINIGQTARLDYLAPNTVVDVSQTGELIKNSSGGFLRDDRPLLSNIARAAWEWYRDKRYAVSLKVHHTSNEMQIGQLIVQLGSDVVNSMVTYITYDFVESSTTVNTEFSEVDPVGLFI